MLSAEELHHRGVEAINAGRVRRARTVLTQARGRTSDDVLLARIEASLAYVEAETGNRPAALALCRRALSRSQLPSHTRGAIQSQLALLLMLAGETARSLATFADAIDSLQDQAEDLGRAHLNRGGVYLQQDLVQQAEADFRAAAAALTEAGLPVEAAKAEHNLGYARFLAGDLVGALRHMDRARVVLAPLSDVSRAVGEQDRAEVLVAAGLTTEGQAALQQSALAYRGQGLRRAGAEAELTLARSLVLTDPDGALGWARRSSRTFVRSDTSALRTRADAVVLAAEVELGRKGPSLLTRGQRLSEELAGQGLKWGATSVRLHTARVLLRRRDPEAAAERLTRVRVDDRAPLDVRLLARDVRAELAEARGRRADALHHLRVGLNALHSWQSSFGSLDLQTNVTGHGLRLARRGLRLAVDSGSPEVLFEWSERARMLSSRVPPVLAPQDEQMVTDLTELRSLVAAADQSGAAHRRREAELRQRIRERAWRLKGSGEVIDPVTLGDLQSAMDPDTALVAYVVAGQRVVALTVTDDSAVCHDLDGRPALEALLGGLIPDLDVAAADLPPAFAANVRGRLDARLADLAGILVEPILDAIGDRRPVLTPSGLLSATPWSLLSGFAGRPVAVARSATSWLKTRGNGARLATAGFVAGPRVARADAETKSASTAWHAAERLTGPAAAVDDVARLAARVDVLHVAAHGRHSAENPLFSGVELADGSWYGYDIDQLPSVPQVVLLSACELGRSSVRFGEELIGMTTAWLHAGVRCVIASPAAVNDRAAHDALGAAHTALREGQDPAAALAAALALLPADAAPAPFVCFV